MKGGEPRPSFLLAVSTVLRPLFAPRAYGKDRVELAEGPAVLSTAGKGRPLRESWGPYQDHRRRGFQQHK